MLSVIRHKEASLIPYLPQTTSPTQRVCPSGKSADSTGRLQLGGSSKASSFVGPSVCDGGEELWWLLKMELEGLELEEEVESGGLSLL